jgi:catechol 2,3-dioxygenase-like lactoylglutathione lyase family enzyme
MVTSLDHVHIYASDPTATLAFFAEVFGAEPLGVLGASGGRQNHLIILGGQVLAVSAFPDGMEPPSPGLPGDGALHGSPGVAHLGFNVEDLDAVLERMVAAGAVVHGSVTQSGPLRYVYASLLDGVVVELTQYALPRRFAPAILALRGLNRTIHRTRRTVGRVLLRLAPS